MDPFPMSSVSATMESHWVATVRRIIEGGDKEEIAEEDGDSGDGGEWCNSSIFIVAKEIASTKPEAYAPQAVAVGPYHRHRPELRQAEWWKLSAARALQRRMDGGLRFGHVVSVVSCHERIIRSHYQRYVDMDSETLAWTMAIDASFLLHFLQTHAALAVARRVDAHNAAILSDLLKLENQIPLLLLRLVAGHHRPALDLPGLLSAFIRHVHPFHAPAPPSFPSSSHPHILHLLYHAVAPPGKQTQPAVADELPTCSPRSALLHCLGATLISVLLRLLAVVGTPPALILLGVLRRTHERSTAGEPECDSERELEVPSASELEDAGARFVAVEGGPCSTGFDARTGTFYLPAVTVGAHTEVLLRNLVAMEAALVEGRRRVVAGYVELMRGVVDGARDVAVLRRCGVLRGAAGRDGEVAAMCDGMAAAAGRRGAEAAAKVDGVAEVVRAVEAWYRRRRWRVWLRRTARMEGRVDFHKVSTFVFLGLVMMLVATHVVCLFRHCGA